MNVECMFNIILSELADPNDGIADIFAAFTDGGCPAP